MYSHLGFKAKRLYGEAGIRGANGDKFALEKWGLASYQGSPPRTIPGEIKDQPDRTQEHQAYVDQFSVRQIQLLAQHTFAAIDIGASGVANEADLSPYPPTPKPKMQVGWLGQLLGIREEDL